MSNPEAAILRLMSTGPHDYDEAREDEFWAALTELSRRRRKQNADEADCLRQRMEDRVTTINSGSPAAPVS